MDPVVIRVTTRSASVAPAASQRVLIVPSPGPAGPAGAAGDGTQIFGEAPTGVKNGSNTAFTLAHTPQTGSTALYRNGLREVLGVGYTVSAATITFTTAPLSSDEIAVDYLMEG